MPHTRITLPRRQPGTHLPPVALAAPGRYVGRARVLASSQRWSTDEVTIRRLAAALRGERL